jgi:hypothetical protein
MTRDAVTPPTLQKPEAVAVPLVPSKVSALLLVELVCTTQFAPSKTELPANVIAPGAFLLSASTQGRGPWNTFSARDEAVMPTWSTCMTLITAVFTDALAVTVTAVELTWVVSATSAPLALLDWNAARAMVSR